MEPHRGRAAALVAPGSVTALLREPGRHVVQHLVDDAAAWPAGGRRRSVADRHDGLGVRLQLGLGAAGADDGPGPVESPDEDVGRHREAFGHRQVFDVDDSPTCHLGRRVGSHGRHGGGDPREPVAALTRIDRCRVTWAPWRASQLVEPLDDRRALGARGEPPASANDQRRGDAVLVAHQVADAVAERLLVPEREPLLRARPCGPPT